ncbi:hypothetical protein FRC09_008245 [Ceratobasidium sp. 395]|nr:hypothetical protein FRC09_008245 [Ceratobasidium sp. 395]
MSSYPTPGQSVNKAGVKAVPAARGPLPAPHFQDMVPPNPVNEIENPSSDDSDKDKKVNKDDSSDDESKSSS